VQLMLHARMASILTLVVFMLSGHFDVELRSEIVEFDSTLLFTSTDTPHMDSPRNLLSLQFLSTITCECEFVNLYSSKISKMYLLCKTCVLSSDHNPAARSNSIPALVSIQ